MSRQEQQQTATTPGGSEQEQQQNGSDGQQDLEEARFIKCNTIVLEYILHKKVDIVVEELLKELPFDHNYIPVRVRLFINHLNGLWTEIEKEDTFTSERIQLIVASVTRLLTFIEERKPIFGELLQSATFTIEDYYKKIKKWLTSFINADTFEHKYQSLESLVKYFNTLGNYIGEPQLYSFIEEKNQEQTTTPTTPAEEQVPETVEKITIDSISAEPCTYLGIKNIGISNNEDTAIFITERLFNARKTVPSNKKPVEQPITTDNANNSCVEDSEDESRTQKKRKTISQSNPQKKRLTDRQSDARRVVVVREFASSEEEEDIPVKKTVKNHLVRKTTKERPRSKSDVSKHAKRASTTVFEDYSSEDDTERVLFQRKKEKSKPKQKRIFWTDDEVSALLRGYKSYGTQWARILAEYKRTFHPERDSVSLRDKYRNMEKYGQL